MSVIYVVQPTGVALRDYPTHELALIPVEFPGTPAMDRYPLGTRCPVDGAQIKVEGPYNAGSWEYPEPGYCLYCPLCDLEWPL
jgi:hypothetical protein